MVDISVTRRAMLGAFGVFAVAPSTLLHGALAQPGVGGVHVDVRPLLQNAGEPTAGWVAQLLPGALAQAMAQRGGAPVGPITVRIDYVMLGPSRAPADRRAPPLIRLSARQSSAGSQGRCAL
jgi:hypothetical protein